MSEQDKLMKLLDDYYGDHRTYEHKSEVVRCIENYYEDIKVIMEESNG